MTKVRPTVVWVSGRSKTGKTAFAKLLSKMGVRIFSTDSCVRGLARWCPEYDVKQKAKESVPARIGRFWDWVLEEKGEDYLASLLLNPLHGFNPDSEISIIEGYVPLLAQRKVIEVLTKQKNFWVWIAT